MTIQPQPSDFAKSQTPAASQAEPAPNPTPDAPKGSSGGELTPLSPTVIGAKMRALLGRSPYYDPAVQVEVDQCMATLATEMNAQGYTQLTVVQDMARARREIDRLARVIETCIQLERPRAARNILVPGWTNYQPPRVNAVRNNGNTNTAYGEFMEQCGGDEADHLTDAEAIAQAIARLAGLGLPESALDDHAYELALDKISKLEELRRTRLAEYVGLLDRGLALLDRRVANNKTTRRPDDL